MYPRSRIWLSHVSAPVPDKRGFSEAGSNWTNSAGNSGPADLPPDFGSPAAPAAPVKARRARANTRVFFTMLFHLRICVAGLVQRRQWKIPRQRMLLAHQGGDALQDVGM